MRRGVLCLGGGGGGGLFVVQLSRQDSQLFSGKGLQAVSGEQRKDLVGGRRQTWCTLQRLGFGSGAITGVVVVLICMASPIVCIPSNVTRREGKASYLNDVFSKQSRGHVGGGQQELFKQCTP